MGNARPHRDRWLPLGVTSRAVRERWCSVVAMSEPPSGTVTFLFADIEGSTRLWEQYPDAMPDALVQHDRLLRAAVQSCGGHVVKTTGDGLFAVFARADSALAAALASQRSLAEATWGA